MKVRRQRSEEAGRSVGDTECPGESELHRTSKKGITGREESWERDWEERFRN